MPTITATLRSVSPMPSQSPPTPSTAPLPSSAGIRLDHLELIVFFEESLRVMDTASDGSGSHWIRTEERWTAAFQASELGKEVRSKLDGTPPASQRSNASRRTLTA